MVSKVIDYIEELRIDIKDIINNINSHALTEYLRDHEYLAAQFFAGFRVNAENAKKPIVKSRILAEAEKDEQFFETLCALLISDKPKLQEAVIYESANSIKKQLDDLIFAYGRLNVKVALLLDDRHNVQSLIKYLNRDVVVENAKPERPPTAPVLEQNPAPANDVQPITSEKTLIAEKAAKERSKKLEHRIIELEKIVENMKGEKAHRDADIKTLNSEISEYKKIQTLNEKQADRQCRDSEKSKQSKALLDEELKAAKRNIRDLQTELTASNAAKKVEASSHTPDWLPIINKMMSGSNLEAAKCFCKTLCAIDENNIHAHLVLRGIYAKKADKENELNECVSISSYFKDNQQFNRSFSYMCDALELDYKNEKIHALFHQSMKTLDINNVNITERIRSKLTQMRTRNAPAYRQASKIIKSFGKAYEKVFFDKPEILHPDKVVEFADGKTSMQLSIRDVIRAIDLNDKQSVDFIKRSLKAMKTKQSETYMRVIKSIANIDESCTDVLNSFGTTVVVDGSNVAHSWRESQKPRFDNIILIRNMLRASGYFPIFIYFDAALVHQIDRQIDLMRMAESGAMIAADIKTDADGSIIDHADKHNCPVVTNDRMLDWDPQGKIRKIRFNIDRFGVEIYD